ncbi:MAG: DEAD/DEAH box helicase family protein [Methylococcaceae bacterium]
MGIGDQVNDHVSYYSGDKKQLSERDICTKYITPAITAAGWDINTQVLEEFSFTKGRVIVRGRLHTRGEPRRADYLLSYQKNQPIAIIEAKNNKHRLGDGMQQALGYAESLDVPFVFTSNGDGFLFHDKTGLSDNVETELSLTEFPSPATLWQRYCDWKRLTAIKQEWITSPYYSDITSRSPHYYQRIAINRTIEAIVNGQQRILLVMATGTGKTYTAFQIIWRLWKSGQKTRILFLADRNILVDQTRNNDFRPFGSAMTKISNRQINKSFEIYLSLYQAVTGNDDAQNIYKQFSPTFFDLVIIDECHRGSAKEDAAWRAILTYFSSATHIGLTATPKETKDTSNSDYFGQPIYTYSLKQGIEDGFLVPYKVIRIDFDLDLNGWRPQPGQKDKVGQLVAERLYNQKDIDKNIVFDERTYLVAWKITEYLQKTGEFQKTIVFCDDIEHAERMRQALVNLNPERIKENRRYIMRITGDEKEGKAELDNFIDPESIYPVIAITSKLMSTGVDAKTCKLIVLDQRIQSMTEFKQIIGRGTRIDESYDKFWFTIIDFKKATELFADPKFDGDPVQIYKPERGGSIVPPEPTGEPEPQPAPEPEDEEEEEGGIVPPPRPPPKPKIHMGNDVKVQVIGIRVTVTGADGKQITESLTDYTCHCVNKHYRTLSDFLRRWTEADQKQVIIQELTEQGVFWEELQQTVSQKLGYELDPFDLICHIVFDQPPLSRKERANNVKKRNYFSQYQGAAKHVLEALLDKYADVGIEEIEKTEVITQAPFSSMGTAVELLGAFGGKANYLKAVKALEDELYTLRKSA